MEPKSLILIFYCFLAKKLSNEEQESYKQKVEIENLDKELNSLKKAYTEQNDAVSTNTFPFYINNARIFLTRFCSKSFAPSFSGF